MNETWIKDFGGIDKQYDFNAQQSAKKALYKVALGSTDKTLYCDDLHGSLFEGTDLDKLAKDFCDMGAHLYFQDMDKNWRVRLFSWDTTFLSIAMDSEEVYFELYSVDKDFFEKISGIVKPLVVPPNVSGKVYVLVSSNNGPKFQSIGVASIPLELDNYRDEVIKDAKHIIQDLGTNTPCGRMVIFDGAPGTGKTYLVRGLLNEIKNAMFVLIPPDLVGELTNPNLVRSIVENHSSLGGPTVFIIEDADKCLASRGPDNLHILSSLLNLSDGIVGSLCDIRVICTTNSQIDDIETAVLRPGRLCRRVHVGELTRQKAAEVYKRLTGNDRTFDEKEVSLAEVYRLARQDGWEPKKLEKKALGFSMRGIMGTDFYSDDE